MYVNYMWVPAPTELILSNNEVHVWLADLNLKAERIQQLAQILSADEQGRAERFYFERDRQHFIAGRGILRCILARYLNIEPQELQFSYGSRGKPALVNTGGNEICFNLSHSNGTALYALALGREVGIDLEYFRPIEAEQIAKRFFCESEYAVISSIPVDKRQEAFFQGWTCKEAYLKATGDGLVGLEQVEVTLTPGEPARLLSIVGDRELAARWLLQEIIIAPDYAGALVVEGQGVCINYWKWTE